MTSLIRQLGIVIVLAQEQHFAATKLHFVDQQLWSGYLSTSFVEDDRSASSVATTHLIGASQAGIAPCRCDDSPDKPRAIADKAARRIVVALVIQRIDVFGRAVLPLSRRAPGHRAGASLRRAAQGRQTRDQGTRGSCRVRDQCCQDDLAFTNLYFLSSRDSRSCPLFRCPRCAMRPIDKRKQLPTQRTVNAGAKFIPARILPKSVAARS